MRVVFVAAIAFAIHLSLNADAQAPTRTEFDSLVQQLQIAQSDSVLRERVIVSARGLESPPPIPEPARRAFVQGATLTKSATDASGQAMAVESFKEVLKLAPWWGDAYYNLAVAQELAGQLSDARASLHFYILSAPAPKEAREAQDRIYALEARERLIAADAAARDAQQHAAADAIWSGTWKACPANFPTSCTTLEGRKVGSVIEFDSGPSYGAYRIYLRGTVDAGGSIAWQLNRTICGYRPVDVSVSSDKRTLTFAVRSFDASTCGLYDDWNYMTVTKQ